MAEGSDGSEGMDGEAGSESVGVSECFVTDADSSAGHNGSCEPRSVRFSPGAVGAGWERSSILNQIFFVRHFDKALLILVRSLAGDALLAIASICSGLFPV
jgi:hypothetical protein